MAQQVIARRLDERERAILLSVHGDPSISIRELGDRVGLRSTSSVWAQLRKLERLGLMYTTRCSCCGHTVRQLTDSASVFLTFASY